jgi:hypothetical protein
LVLVAAAWVIEVLEHQEAILYLLHSHLSAAAEVVVLAILLEQ